MRYRITHTTAYTYESEVSESYGEAHLLPRDMPGQQVRSSTLTVDPDPEESGEWVDYFGNRTSYFTLRRAHSRLAVTAVSEVDVEGRGIGGQLLADQSWESVRDLLERAGRGAGSRPDPDALAALTYAVDSPQVSHPGQAVIGTVRGHQYVSPTADRACCCCCCWMTRAPSASGCCSLPSTRRTSTETFSPFVSPSVKMTPFSGAMSP